MILTLICVGFRVMMRNIYVASVPMYGREIREQDIQLVEEMPGIVGHGEPRCRTGACFFS